MPCVCVCVHDVLSVRSERAGCALRGVCIFYAWEGKEHQVFMSKYLHIFHSFEQIKHFSSLLHPQERQEHLLFGGGLPFFDLPASFNY